MFFFFVWVCTNVCLCQRSSTSMYFSMCCIILLPVLYSYKARAEVCRVSCPESHFLASNFSAILHNFAMLYTYRYIHGAQCPVERGFASQQRGDTVKSPFATNRRWLRIFYCRFSGTVLRTGLRNGSWWSRWRSGGLK